MSEFILPTKDSFIEEDEGHGDPNVYTWWKEKFQRPVAESKYIVSVKSNKKEWRNLYNFAELYIYPSYYLNKIDGATYVEKYQYELNPSRCSGIVEEHNFM